MSDEKKKRISKKPISQKSKYPNQRSLSYDAGGEGRRSEGWGVYTSPNSALIGSVDRIRKRSRHEARNNAWAASISETIVSNVVGAGIKPMTPHSDLQKLWNKWVDEADSAYYSDFYGLQALALRSVVEGGDCFVRLRQRRMSDGLSVPFQLQLIEAEQCPTTLRKPVDNGNEVIGGVEFNSIGKPTFYHMYKNHPHEVSLKADSELLRLPAENVLHLRLMKRPGEVRGEPWLTQALVRLRELDLYNDAELVRKKSAALYGGFIYTPNMDDDEDIISGITGERVEGQEDVVIDPLEPGTFPVLPPGYDVKFSQPADVGGNFEAFMKAQLRAIAVAVGITYEQLTGDFSSVNDRVIRASLLEFKRRAGMWQWHLMVHQFCRPVWKRFVDLAILSGAWTPPDGLSEDEIFAVKWTPHNWGYLHPVQEISAYKDAIRSGLTSRARVVSELGEDVEDIDAEIAKDNQRADDLGLSFDSDARLDKPNNFSDNNTDNDIGDEDETQ